MRNWQNHRMHRVSYHRARPSQRARARRRAKATATAAVAGAAVTRQQRQRQQEQDVGLAGRVLLRFPPRVGAPVGVLAKRTERGTWTRQTNTTAVCACLAAFFSVARWQFECFTAALTSSRPLPDSAPGSPAISSPVGGNFRPDPSHPGQSLSLFGAMHFSGCVGVGVRCFLFFPSKSLHSHVVLAYHFALAVCL